MADNIEVTPGTGAIIAAEDVGGGVLVQKVKLTVGASGTAVDVVGGSGGVTTGTPRVTLATDVALPTGSNVLGKVGVQVGGSDLADGHPVPVVEGNSAAPITGASMPAGGVGLTGWLSAIWTRLAGVVLAAGTAVIGKVGIDQTTDGTTNLVAAKQSGAWNVTNVSGTVSLPTGAATAAKQPALGTAGTPSSDVITVQGVTSGTPLTTAAAPATGAVYNGVTALTPKFAAVVASASGATTIIAAVTSKKIRVLAIELMANGTVNAKWQSHTTPTDLTGLAYLVANSGYVLPFSPTGWFETVSGEALDINLSAAIAVGGSIVYVEV